MVIARRKHDTTRGVVLLKCATRVRTYLYHENVADGEFGTYAEKGGSHSAAVGVRQFREIASSHENFRLRQPSEQSQLSRERLQKTKMNGINDGTAVSLAATLAARLRCSKRGSEFAVGGGHKKGGGPCCARDVEPLPVGAEKNLPPRHSSST